MLEGKSILVTGGTGSFGKHFIGYLLEKYPQIKKIIVFSRDEHKQYEMKHEFKNHTSLEFVLGDIRDYDRLFFCLQNIDYVIHAAALKHIHIAEANPVECIKTNILGSDNVIRASQERGVEKVIAISTDKASSPSSIYGASKLCADKLFIHANNSKTQFTVVRYANVFGSVGSVVPFFLQKAKDKKIPITHPEMTRFSITADEASKLVEYAILNAVGGEILVPKLPVFKILDLAEAVCSNCQIDYIGIRAGEKIHEEIISQTDALYTTETSNLYIIGNEKTQDLYLKHYKGEKVSENFSYSSDKSNWILTVDDLKKLL
ncbi:hypothetical protein AD998_05790 [bacterium 336/3]|nr:hypothetical protein AD998_05790 [bacterium 336/3]